MDATGQYIPNMHLSHIKHFLWHCRRGPPLTPLWTLHASALDPLGLLSSPTLCFLCKGPEAGECLAYLSNNKEATGLPRWLSGKESNAGDMGLIPESGRSPGEGNGNPLQYSCLENSMDREPGRLQSMGSQNLILLTQPNNNRKEATVAGVG